MPPAHSGKRPFLLPPSPRQGPRTRGPRVCWRGGSSERRSARRLPGGSPEPARDAGSSRAARPRPTSPPRPAPTPPRTLSPLRRPLGPGSPGLGSADWAPRARRGDGRAREGSQGAAAQDASWDAALLRRPPGEGASLGPHLSRGPPPLLPGPRRLLPQAAILETLCLQATRAEAAWGWWVSGREM